MLLAPLQACGPGFTSLAGLHGLPHHATPTAIGIDLAYSTSASERPATGATIVYVHGTPGDASVFARYLRRPVRNVFSIAVHRPGFGKTGGPAMCSFEDQARAIEPLLPEGERVVLVGHSLGGPIVARAAADYPERIAAIVILAGSLDPQLEKPRWFNYAGAGLHPLLPRTVRNSNMEIFDAPRQTLLLAEVLGRVRCPVVIVHGSRDTLVPHANVEYMRTSFTGAASVDAFTLHGANHFIPWTHEAEIRAAIEFALDRAAEQSGP